MSSTPPSEQRIAIVGDDTSFMGELREALEGRGMSARRLTANALRSAARAPDLTLLVGNAALDGGARMVEEIGSDRGPYAIIAPQGALAARIEARRRGVAILARKDDLQELAHDVARLLDGESDIPFGTPVERVISDVKTEVGQRLGNEPSLLRIRPGEESRAKELVDEFVAKLAAISEPGATPSQPPPAPMNGLDWDDDPQTVKRSSQTPPMRRNTIPGVMRFPSAAALLASEGDPDPDLTMPMGPSEADLASMNPSRSDDEDDDDDDNDDDDGGQADAPAASDPDVTARHEPIDAERLHAMTGASTYDSTPPIYPAVPPPPRPPRRPGVRRDDDDYDYDYDSHEDDAPRVILSLERGGEVDLDAIEDFPSALVEAEPLTLGVAHAVSPTHSLPPPVPPGARATGSHPSLRPVEHPASQPAAAAPASKPASAAPKKGGGGFLMYGLVLVVLLGLAGGGAAAAYFYLNDGRSVIARPLPDDPLPHDPLAHDPNVELDANPIANPPPDPPPVDTEVPENPEGIDETAELPEGTDPVDVTDDEEEPPAVAGEPRAAADTLVTEGETLERAQRLDDARRAFEQAIALYETHPHAHAGLARVLIAQGDGAAALPHAERAATLRRRRVDYHVLVGDARAAAGDTPGARRAYQRALDLDPSNAEATERLGASGGP